MEPESSLKGQEVLDSNCNIGKPTSTLKKTNNFFFVCLGGGQTQVVQRDCAVSILGDIQGHDPGQPSLGDPA